MKRKYFYIIEYEDGYYLSIGRKAPWMNDIQIKIPSLIYNLFF